MRTSRTVTVFGKLETPPENLEQAHPPRKFGAGTPPENLEQAPPPKKFGAGTPPKIWSRHPPEEQAPPPKIWNRHPPQTFGAGTPPPKIWNRHPPKIWSRHPPPPPPPPVNRMTDRCKNITLAKTSFRPVKIMVKIILNTFVSFLSSTKSFVRFLKSFYGKKLEYACVPGRVS